jgi:hypothetical protein
MSEPVGRSGASAPDREEELRALLIEAHEQLIRRDGEIEALIHDLQANLTETLQQGAPDGGGDAGTTDLPLVPGEYLRYRQLVRRVQESARNNLPPGANVVVVSRGDETLLELGEGHRGWHFPQGRGGVYAGHYPADSAEAIDHLEELRSRGAEFLMLPETSFWWLEHYEGFRKHLEDRYRLFVRQEETCLIFALGEAPEKEHGGAPTSTRDERVAHGGDPA